MPGLRSGSPSTLRWLVTALALAAGVAGAVGLLNAPSSAPRRAAVARPLPLLVSRARHGLQTFFQDDQLLLYSRTPTVVRTLDTLRALGVTRLRITVVWAAIAPAASASVAPAGFDPTDPAAYPPGAWAPYDRVLELARARGLGVDFDLTAPGPLWAMSAGAPLPREANHYYPLAASFEHFVIAAGRRYSGHDIAPGTSRALPRVGFWSVWNEPNQPGWLAPQTVGGVIEAARLYRGYVDAAYAGLQLTGHGSDTLLIGELAPEGDALPGASRPVAPLPFLRALYCMDAADRPLTGVLALDHGCPTAGFVTAHPGLFSATGFAHHPYSFFLAPDASMSDPNFAPLADLGRLQRSLDAIFAGYGVRRRLPLYLTEYGYETNPPNPFRGVSPDRQAAYLDQAAYLAWRDPRVRALAQFQLRDSPPDRAFPPGSVGYWSTFQTGLEYADGRPKPAFHSYLLPIYLPHPSLGPGGRVTVWGMLRAAPHGRRRRAQLQWRPPAGSWHTVDEIIVAGRAGVLLVHVTLPGAGAVRLKLLGRAVYSRVAPVSAGAVTGAGPG